ncbi:hypothetical protein [Streptomyces sp. NPDC102437]|uniref:hypothetical protein n=1 Tax=Streptomyces sp. NPDC102437 TaxID=3366175 RepID=UPI00381F170D
MQVLIEVAAAAIVPLPVLATGQQPVTRVAAAQRPEHGAPLRARRRCDPLSAGLSVVRPGPAAGVRLRHGLSPSRAQALSGCEEVGEVVGVFLLLFEDGFDEESGRGVVIAKPVRAISW